MRAATLAAVLPALASAAWPISQTLVVSLTRDALRTANMARQLAYLRVPYTRITAVDKDVLRAAVRNNPADPPLVGVVDERLSTALDLSVLAGPPFSDFYSGDLGVAGCALSHAHALLTATDAVAAKTVADGPILVLEDDVQLDSEFVARTAAIIADADAADPLWSMVALGHCYAADVVPVEGHELVARASRYYCAHAYVLRNAAAASAVLAALLSEPGRVPVWDFMLLGMWVDSWDAFRTYVVSENDLAVQDRRSFDTHIPMSERIPHLAVRTPIPVTRHAILVPAV